MTSSSRQPELPFSGGEPDNPPEAGDGPLVSLLSLKLLLLAFFILLNAMSELEALKVRAVLESVTKAFDGRLVVEENVARSAAAEGPLEGAEIFLKETGRIFNSLLPAVSRAESARSRSLIVELPIGTFFPKESAGCRRGGACSLTGSPSI